MIQMAIGECLAYSNLQADSSLQLGLRGGSHLALTNYHLYDLSDLIYGFVP